MKQKILKHKYLFYGIAVLLILKLFKIEINLDLIKNIIIGLVIFICTLSPLVIIHEFAHFLVGKKLGAEPEVFSIGMGKKLFGFKWLGADFIVSAIPLGGYVRFKKVQFHGENGQDASNEVIEPWKWFFIALAGPVSNFLLAFIVFFGLFFTGISYLKFSKNPDDNFILDENNQFTEFVILLSKTQVLKDINTHKPNVVFNFNKKVTVTDIDYKKFSENSRTLSLLEKFKLSSSLSYDLMVHFGTLTAQSLYKIITNVKDNYHQVSSPIGISQQVKFSLELGWLYVLIMFGALSFGLGFMNILPLSVLDGGRSLMALYQTFVSKNISIKFLNVINNFSVLIVLFLMGVGFFSDLMKNSEYNKDNVKQENVNEKNK